MRAPSAFVAPVPPSTSLFSSPTARRSRHSPFLGTAASTPAKTAPPNSIATATRAARPAPASMTLFASVPPTPGDPILSLQTAFRADPSPQKVNLGIGAFRTAAGAPYPLPSLRRSAQRLLSDAARTDHEYLPQDGLPALHAGAAELLLGAGSPALPRAVAVQALSGTGALRLALEFLRGHVDPAPPAVLVPQPTWPNHFGVAAAAGFEARTYRYYDEARRALDLPGMLADLRAAPRGAVVVLHACAHNPTGADPAPDDWAAIEEAVAAAGLLPLFDVAYQGFASGDLDRDAAAVRRFAAAGRDLLIAQSYAKNMGLYGERVGALVVVTAAAGKDSNAEEAAAAAAVCARVRERLKRVARTMYSNPPAFGARVAALALGALAPGEREDDAGAVAAARGRRAAWEGEVREMAGRLNDMRAKLADGLVKKAGPEWGFLHERSGMFAYLGLSRAQTVALRERFHVYAAGGGRVSLAGLNDDNIAYVVDALAAVIAEGEDVRVAGRM